MVSSVNANQKIVSPLPNENENAPAKEGRFTKEKIVRVIKEAAFYFGAVATVAATIAFVVGFLFACLGMPPAFITIPQIIATIGFTFGLPAFITTIAIKIKEQHEEQLEKQSVELNDIHIKIKEYVRESLKDLEDTLIKNERL